MKTLLTNLKERVFYRLITPHRKAMRNLRLRLVESSLRKIKVLQTVKNIILKLFRRRFLFRGRFIKLLIKLTSDQNPKRLRAVIIQNY